MYVDHRWCGKPFQTIALKDRVFVAADTEGRDKKNIMFTVTLISAIIAMIDTMIMTDQADDEDDDSRQTDYETTSDFSETSRCIELLVAQRSTDT